MNRSTVVPIDAQPARPSQDVHPQQDARDAGRARERRFVPALANATGIGHPAPAEAALAASHAPVEADETARRQLARELHDSVGAELTASRLALASVETWLPADAPPQCREALTIALRSLDIASEAVRHTLAGLHAPQLDDGLVPALADWTRDFSARTGLPVALDCAADARLARLPADAAIAVFRVTQEALANAVRHAHASHADVRLESGADHLTLIVADNGIGLPERAANRPGRHGLTGMHERCAAFGGTLRIRSMRAGAGSGTTVRARFAWAALLAAGRTDAGAAGHAMLASARS
ncbi:histidine kinase [Burkholderia sp. WAC0059]|uniref:sensor histidine kinase n=1 Tax=Burkholderia sp. WAC0059 TaxID=2066022 RepID=UPI000C7F07C0|nr:sensor histidine kinase [Burkholderia sp. WAC0059]PLZ02299.1 histidine kinase [Burkholderia sp. WAC0059]